jgi:hypothetical protein
MKEIKPRITRTTQTGELKTLVLARLRRSRNSRLDFFF